MSSAQELQEQGVKQFQQKEFEEAARLFQEAGEAYEAAGQKDIAAEMQVNLALTRRSMGANQEAIDLMSQALSTFTELNDQKRRAMVLGNMGGVYVALNDKEQAAECYREAADIFQELGEKKLHGETLLAIANLQMSNRKVGDAAATYEAGLSELDNLSVSQKMIKGLIGFKNSLTGGGKPAIESESDDENG